MSEQPDASMTGDMAQHAGDASAAAMRAGAMLRQTREAHGLHVDAMAFSLKVPVAKLEALEAGRLDLLPDLVFARGLAASVCRNLKVDPAPVLGLLPRNGGARLAVDAPTINAPFRPPGSGSSFSVRGRMFSPAVIAVVVLLVGALLLLVWPKMHDEAATSTTSTTVGEAPPPPLMDPTATPAEPAASTVSTAPNVSTPASGATLPATPAPAAAVAAPAVSAPVGSAIFVLSAEGESWVKVTDAKGVVSLNRIIKPGETVQADGTPPLAVVVGRADLVKVQVRGQPLDLVPMTKVNVARFEVK